MSISPLDLSLQNKYRNALIGIGSINNISSNTSFDGNVTATSDLFVSSNTIFENNSTVKSNLFVSNNTIFNSNVNVNSYYSCNSISLQNITIKSNLNVSGNMTLVGNTSILSNLVGLGNLNSNSLQVNGNVNVNSNILNQTTMLSNLNILGNANIKNITPINTLFISGITILQDTTINSTLNISSTGLLNNITINNSLNISSNCILNSVSINSQLLVSNYLVINNNLTVNSSLSINTNSVFNNSVSTGSLICYLNSNIKNSSTINSFLNVSGVSVFNSNITGLGNLSVSGNTVVNGISTILSSLYVSNNTNINNNVIANNTSTINSNLTVSGNTTLVNLTGPNSIVMNQIPEYLSNQDAADGGIPLWGYYRTGGILKIRTDTVSPIITLTGSNNITIYTGQTYTELGATATDNLDISIPIIITGTVNILQVGVYVLRYTAIDSYNNQSFVTRTVNIILDTQLPQVYLNGSDNLKLNINDNYIESGITIKTNNPKGIAKYNFNISTPPVYLYIENNYSILGTSNWTIECYINLASYNYVGIVDFRRFPLVTSANSGGVVIGNNGNLGVLLFNSSRILYSTSNPIPLNTWTHIAYQKNNTNMEFYVNGIFSGSIDIGNDLTAPNLLYLTQLFIGACPLLSDTNWQLKGSLNQLAISSTLRYSSSTNFTPTNTILTDSSTIFFLGDNYKDNISNKTLSYNIAPLITYSSGYAIDTTITPTITIYNSTTSLTPVSSINTSTAGKYVISYSATDISGNISNIVYRNIYILNINTLSAYQMNNPNTYLYLANNYNALTTYQYWTIECWIYLTAYSSTNYYTLIDFRNLPNTISNAQFALIISNTGMLGYWYGSSNSFNICPGSSNVPLNTWSHIAYQRNGIFMDFYVNGTFAGNLNIDILFNSSNISNLNQITLGHSVNQSISGNTLHLLGSLSQVKISLGNKYTMAFVPNDNLSYDLTNTLFFLNNNYFDSITNSQMTYNLAPIIVNRQYFIKSTSNTIESRNLVFNLQVSNLSTTWIDTTGNYSFIVHPNANNYSSLSKTQNGYGWKRSGNIGWTMNNSSSITFKNINWSQGYTLEQWIYIDYDFIPSKTVSMLLVGQSSMFNTNDYGFAFNQINFPYNTNYGNVLAYTGNSQGAGLSRINLNNLRGKWTHVVATTNQTNNTLNVYVNGGLFSTLTSYTNWGNPALSTNIFTIGCNSNNGTIQSESLNRVHFGNTRMYSRPLVQDEILNNYNIELPYYQTPTSDIYFIKSPNTISSNTITNYDFTSGWLSQSIDLNQMRIVDSWTIECWAYPTSWGSSNDEGWIIDLSVGSNYLAFGVTSSITNITPSITYDGSGRPFIYYSGDTIGQWKIKSSQIVPLNQWNHIVWQKNNVSTLEMFVNGISTGTFTVNASDWNYPNFVSTSGINNIIIGGSTINLSSTTNHWKGKLSQVKITLGKKYTGPFTSLFDLSVNDNGLFLLQDNFFNNSIGKTMNNNNNVIIPTYSSPKIIIIGSTSLTLFVGINTYTELGYNVSYYQRTLTLSQNIIGNVDTSTLGSYSITYAAIDSLLNIGYAKRIINVIKYNIPPTISLKGSSLLYLQLGTTYNELGVTITNNLSQTINPVISGSVNTLIIGQYIITYTATDSYGNSASVARTLIVFNIPINGISFWLDPSNNSTITKDSANTVTNITDISGNNIVMNINLGSPKLSTNTINNLTVLDLTNGSSMISSNSSQNSADLTVAVIGTFFAITPTYSGMIFGHYADESPIAEPSNNRWYSRNMSLKNGGTNNQNIILLSSYDSSVGIPIQVGVQVMIIGVLSNGTFRYLKMINLQTGEEFTTNGTNISTILIMDSFYWLGMSVQNRPDQVIKCHIGEIMYWKRVLSFREILNIENYLFNKWGNKNATLTYTTLTPKIIFKGSSTFYLNIGSLYIEPGITLNNTVEPNLVPVITGTYDINTPGTYTLTYTVTDSMNNIASADRNIIVSSNSPVNTYDTTYGNLQLTNLNFNALSNTNWTVECWLYISQNNPTPSLDNEGITIFDFRQVASYATLTPNIIRYLPSEHMWLSIDQSSYTPIINNIFQKITFNINTTINLNTWNHYVWMRYNDQLYVFVNGVCSTAKNILTSMNNFTQLNSIVMGIYSYYNLSNSTNYHFMGQICQPLITLGAKYSTSGFTPKWNLTPLNYTNVLFWLQNNIDVISNQPIVLNRTVVSSTIYSQPMIPTLTVKGKQYNYVIVNQTYTDPGVTVQYTLNPNIIPYITSITDNNGNQFITTPLNALNSNIISNLNTGVVNTIYTITYSVQYTSTESITLTRIITVLLTALPTTLWTTSKNFIFANKDWYLSPSVYYYINNGVYTSSDSVEFTNGTNIIYCMDNNQIVSSNVVTTDSNGIMWATVGLMTMQVYNPMNYSINYNNNSYSLYINTNVLLNSNGVYKNNNGNDFVYQYQNKWYYSTDMITFYKILFNSTYSIVVGLSSTSPIYLYNNMVLTTLPSIQTTNNKTYWNFGIVYVNPINLSDCYLYYNNTIYYQQTPQNSYAPGTGLSRYTPTYISSGTLFSASNNTIIFQIGLGFIIITKPESIANFIKIDGTLDSTNIYNNLNTSQSLGYSSKSGYFTMQAVATFGNATFPIYNITYLLNMQFKDINTNITMLIRSGFEVLINNRVLPISGISFKPTGTGTLQYVINCYNCGTFDPFTNRQPTISTFSGNVAYISFETTSYITFTTNAYHWNDNLKVFTNTTFTANCTNLSFNYIINPACLEPFIFTTFNLAWFNNNTIQIINNNLTALPITQNLQTVAFTANLFNQTGNGNFFSCIAAPAAHLAIGTWGQARSNLYDLIPINQYNSDFSYNGNIITWILSLNYKWGPVNP